MVLTLVLYALWTAALLAAGVALATRVAGPNVRVQRFAWAGAMATAVALLAFVPLRMRSPEVGADTQAIDAGALARLTDGLDAPLTTMSHATGGLPAWLTPLVAALWAVSSLAFLVVLLTSYRRHRRQVARAARVTVAGTPVRVADGLGPAVIGVLRPDIVVPAWLLGRPEAEQRLIVRHELSHVAVGDPLLLLAGCAAVAVMPWNPAMWYLLGRLRLAIELDCDRRVLDAGARMRDYGAALIELTALLPRRIGGISAPAFAYRPSHLERRLTAMTAKPMSYRRIRLAAAASVAAAALVVACDSQLPTSAEIEAMDVAEVEAQSSPLLRLGGADTRYLLDGDEVTREVAAAVPAEKIARIEVARASVVADTKVGDAEIPSNQVLSIHVITTDAPPEMRMQPRDVGVVRELRRPLTKDQLKGAPSVILRAQGDSSQTFEGVLVIDGVIAERSRLQGLDPEKIKNVEIVKGAAGERLYGPRGAKGVIIITTKEQPQ